MSQNINLLGASYSDVPSVLLPKVGGGLAQFDDTTDADATTSDIAIGKTAYVNGAKITGTASGGGGGSHSTETYYLKFYPSTELSNTNKLSLQLTASENCFVFVHAVTRPSPPASGYKALFWAYPIYRFTDSYAYSYIGHAILRANDTIGTDASQCVFTPATGVLQLGGQYGHFFPEDEYEVIQIVFS